MSCLEQGRWGRRQAYRRDSAFAAARVRSVQHAGVARSMRQTGSRDGDQTAVWSEINQMLSQASVGSPTAAAADMSRRLSDESRHAPPWPRNSRRAGLSVSNSSSGRRWKLDHAPAVGDPTHMVEFGTGRRAFAREA